MIRAVLALPSFVAATLLGSVLAVLLADSRQDRRFRAGPGTPVVARRCSASPGVKLEVNMRVPLDPKRPYVFMANHASMVGHLGDVRGGCRCRFRFIAKKQLGPHPALRLGDARGPLHLHRSPERGRGPAQHRRGGAPDRGWPVGRDLPRRDAHPRRPAGALQEGRFSPGHGLGRGRSSRSPSSARAAHHAARLGAHPRAASVRRRGRRADLDRRSDAPPIARR